MTDKQPRVLVIAEAANPDWVSVPLVGWQIASALRQVADVHIVTQVRNRSAFIDHGMVEGRDFTALDSEALAAPFYKLAERLRGGAGKGWTTVTALQSLAYPFFERLVWTRFGRAILAGDYDIVHRVTPLSPTAPSSLARRCRRAGVPFLLGPLNGGLPWHPEFTKERVKEREWLSYLRKVYKYLPGIRSTYRNATAIIAGSHHTAHELARYGKPVVYIPENGIHAGQFRPVRRPHVQGRTIRLVFVGRLVPYKGADIAIEACHRQLKAGLVHLDIVGDGPEMALLRSLVERFGIEEAVTFHGWKSHESVAEFLAGADLMVFPSVREFGGGVVLEAMACGVVPVVIDYGGPGELVTAACGFAVPIGPRASLIREIERFISAIVAGEYDLAPMSAAAEHRSRALYGWHDKAKQISVVYRWLMGHDRILPDFGFGAIRKMPPFPLGDKQ